MAQNHTLFEAKELLKLEGTSSWGAQEGFQMNIPDAYRILEVCLGL